MVVILVSIRSALSIYFYLLIENVIPIIIRGWKQVGKQDK